MVSCPWPPKADPEHFPAYFYIKNQWFLAPFVLLPAQGRSGPLFHYVFTLKINGFVPLAAQGRSGAFSIIVLL